MTIRKTGSATGEVTGIEAEPAVEDGIQATAAAGSHAWESGDDHELGAENDAADAAPSDG